MGILKGFFGPVDGEVKGHSVKASNVVSTLQQKEKRIEKRLAVCMKEIQQLMANQRKLKKSSLANNNISKILVKTSLRVV